MIHHRAGRPPRIVVVGAGGLGGYLGAVLHRGGASVHLLARGRHLEAIRSAGLSVVEEAGESVETIPASESVPQVGPGDIALVTVKAHGLEGVLPLLVEASGSGAWIVPLVNGVDTVSVLSDGGVSRRQIILGVAYVTAFRTDPGRVERKGDHGRILVGFPATSRTVASSAREALQPMPRILADSGVQVAESTDIELEAWRKMLVVTALTGGCAAGSRGIGEVLATEPGRRLVRDLVAEAAAVARAHGVDLGAAVEVAAFERVCAFPHDFRPSLIHDLDKGVPTEVEALNGAIVRMGSAAGVPTPQHDRAAHAIRTADAAVAPSPSSQG